MYQIVHFVRSVSYGKKVISNVRINIWFQDHLVLFYHQGRLLDKWCPGWAFSSSAPPPRYKMLRIP